jgi:glyoxylase-like metal-dependent hydrolase (beta-lactamase superfamily II)
MTLTGTNAYVVGSEPAYVIDPGPALEEHVEAVRVACDERGGCAGVVLTHSHADHSEAVGALKAPLLWGAVSEHDETSPPDATLLTSGRVATQSQERAAETAEAGPFTAIPTPGHAADHTSFQFGDVVFCGDLVLGEGSSIVPPAAYGGSLADYMDSLERLRDLGPSLMCPGHGPWIEDPRAKIDEYLAHRRRREQKLVAALDAGERSRARLLAAVWDDVPEVLRPAAAVAMQAHLEKLMQEGVTGADALED